MPFLVNPSRRYVFEHAEGDNSFKAYFDFPCIEDRKVDAEKFKGLDTENPDPATTMSIVWGVIRRALCQVEGLNDASTVSEENPDGLPLDISTEEMQKAAFEFIIRQGDLRDKIFNCYLGLNAKN